MNYKAEIKILKHFNEIWGFTSQTNREYENYLREFSGLSDLEFEEIESRGIEKGILDIIQGGAVENNIRYLNEYDLELTVKMQGVWRFHIFSNEHGTIIGFKLISHSSSYEVYKRAEHLGKLSEPAGMLPAKILTVGDE